MQRHLGPALLSFAALVMSAPVAAQTSARLRYEAPASCPDELGFVDLVRARSQGALFDASAASELVVSIEETVSPGLRGRIEWRSPDGEPLGQREIDGTACASLAETLAVVASLALESLAELVEPEPQVVVRVVERDPERPPVLTPSPPPPGPSIGVALHVAAGVGYGPGPLPHPSFELGAALTYDALMIPLAFRYSDTFAYGGVDGGYGLRTRLVRGVTGGCFVPAPFELCGVVSLGVLEGEAQGVAEPQLAQSFFASLGATFGVTAMLDAHLGVRGRAALDAVLNRTTFVVDATPLWTGLPVLVELDVSVLSRW